MPSEKHPKAKSVESLRHAEYYDMQRTFDELYTRSQAREVFDNLMELILSKDNIMLAYRNIKSNSGSATPPNCFGKDLFFLEVDEDKTSVIPNKVWGMYDSSKKGAYKIIKDGWKFAKDYPW